MGNEQAIGGSTATHISTLISCTKHPLMSRCNLFLVAVAALLVGRSSLFGHQLGSFDEEEDAQDTRGEAVENYAAFGEYERLEDDTDDLGTGFESGEEDHHRGNAHHYQHHHLQGYPPRSRRPLNIRPPINACGPPLRRKGGKTQRLASSTPGSNALTPHDPNIMTKDKKAAASGKTPIKRSDTENKRLKEQVAAKNREAEELKRKISELQKEQNSSSGKKAKVQEPHKVVPKTENKGHWIEIKDNMKSDAYPLMKFLSNKQEEIDFMLLCLKNTTMWKDLEGLSSEDQRKEAESYVEVYGRKMTSAMNELRTQHQSALRTKWINANVDGGAPTAGQLLKVARRNPNYLQFLDEEGGTPEENKKNKEVNAQNRKYRDRFKTYISVFLPTCSPNWSIDLVTKHILSDFVEKDTDEDMAPAATEAMVILFVENNEKKWHWQTGVCKEHGNVSNFFEKLKADQKKPAPEQIEPLPKHSSSTCGNKSCGGWSQAGKKRHREILKLIQQGRALETTNDIEEFLRKELEEELGDDKRANDEEVAVLDEDEEEEDDADPGYESCDSDEEQAEMNQHKFLTKKEIVELEKKQQEAAEAQKAEEEAQKAEEGTGKEEEEALKAEGQQASSPVNEDQEGKENKKGSGGKGGKTKKPSPPQPAQQVRHTRGGGGRRVGG